MKFNLKDSYQRNKAITYFNKLLENQSKIEITKLRQGRSIPQNAYLHVCYSLYAIHFGYTLEEAKHQLKSECQFMVYLKNGTYFLKSTSCFNTKEMTDWIEWIRNYSSQNGLYIPTSEEYILHKEYIDNDIESNKCHL